MEPAERIKQLEKKLEELEIQITAYKQEAATIAEETKPKPAKFAERTKPKKRRIVWTLTTADRKRNQDRLRQMQEAQREQARPWMGDIETR